MALKIQFKTQPISLYTRWLGIFFVSLIVGALHIGAIGSLLRILGFIPIVIWLFSKSRIRFSAPIKCAFLYVAWVSLTSVWSIDQSVSFSRTISQVSFLLLLISAASYDFSEHEIEYLKKCLVWGSRVTAVVVLISANYLAGRIYLNGIVQEDPNYLCAYFSFALVMALMSLISGAAKGKWWILYIAELIVYAYIILGTGSRGGLFAIITAVAIVILFTPAKNHKSARIVGRIAIVALLFVAAYIATSFIEKDILLRFSLEEIEESGGTGRYEIWNDALDAFGNSSFLRQVAGYGTGTARNITYLFPFSHHNVFHNMFVESLLEAGVIGLLLYVAHIWSFMWASLKRKDLFCVAIMACLFVLSLSTSIYTFKPYWNIMLFILCVQGQVAKTDETPRIDAPAHRW